MGDVCEGFRVFIYDTNVHDGTSVQHTAQDPLSCSYAIASNNPAEKNISSIKSHRSI